MIRNTTWIDAYKSANPQKERDMENKINIAEILKDCPKGMELDCIICNNPVVLEDVIEDNNPYPIRVTSKDFYHLLTKYGCLYDYKEAKCVIFPKGKTTWEGFQRPFKDGDIVATKNGKFIGIVKIENNKQRYGYVTINEINNLGVNMPYGFERLATEEEKQKLFDVIKKNGYKWNAETKALEKLIEPKFKVGDRIVKRGSIGNPWIVSSVSSEYYGLKLSKGSENIGVLPICEQDDYELLSNKFDIATLVPFESKVLVRQLDGDYWRPAFWGCYNKQINPTYPFLTTFGTVRQCVPYENNEHLLRTNDDCDEYYKTWE